MTIVLPGLEEARFPLSALTAFGLLRVCAEMGGPKASLAWTREGGGWSPQLTCPGVTGGDDLVQRLAERQRGRAKAPVFAWGADITGQPGKSAGLIQRDTFSRLMAEAGREAADGGSREAGDFLAAVGCEAVPASQVRGNVARSPFHMLGGQQRLLPSVRNCIALVDPAASPPQDVVRRIHGALFGPWEYESQGHALGWDHAMVREHAYEARSPSNDPTAPRMVAAAVWLAIEALPLFPTAAVDRRVAVPGWSSDESDKYWCFPIWSSPLTLRALRALLASPAVVSGRRSEVEALGVSAVYRTRRVDLGQARATFGRAQLVVSA